MSHWDSAQQKTIRWEPRFYDDYSDWLRVDCGCCAGIEWGGDYPRECDRCMEGGWVAVHVPTGSVALYPGGPFRGGKYRREEVDALVAAVGIGPTEVAR